MYKVELISKISKQRKNLYQRDVKKALDAIIEEISDGLKSGKRVEIRGFGTFSTRHRKSHEARNPRTGQKILVDDQYTVVFKPSKDLRERINSDLN